MINFIQDTRTKEYVAYTRQGNHTVKELCDHLESLKDRYPAGDYRFFRMSNDDANLLPSTAVEV